MTTQHNRPTRYSIRLDTPTGDFYAYLKIGDRSAWSLDHARRIARTLPAHFAGYKATVEHDGLSPYPDTATR